MEKGDLDHAQTSNRSHRSNLPIKIYLKKRVGDTTKLLMLLWIYNSAINKLNFYKNEQEVHDVDSIQYYRYYQLLQQINGIRVKCSGKHLRSNGRRCFVPASQHLIDHKGAFTAATPNCIWVGYHLHKKLNFINYHAIDLNISRNFLHTFQCGNESSLPNYISYNWQQGQGGQNL